MQVDTIGRKTLFYISLFPYVSRKKTKRGPFLKVNAGSLFDKKYVFSESQGEKQKKEVCKTSKKMSKNPLFFQKKRSVLSYFIENFSNRVEVNLFFWKIFNIKIKNRKKSLSRPPLYTLCKSYVSRGLRGLQRGEKTCVIYCQKESPENFRC